MKNLFYKILFVAAMFAANTSVSAQTLMRVHLNDGSIISALVANIDSVTWATTDIGQNVEGETSVTGLATNITKNSATITSFANGILENLATDIRVGIIYTSYGTPTRSNGTIIDVNTNTIASDGSYSITLTGLNPETTYSYRSFVFQSGIWFYGDIRTFTTTGSGEMFTTGAASDVTCFSASVAASVNVDASVPYSTLSYGICYGTTIDPTTDGLHTETKNRNVSTGEFSVILRGLYGGTIYYYRPYAVIDGVTKYGLCSQFRTLDDNVVETVGFDTENKIATAHLTLGSGAFSSMKLGFCYARTEIPTISDYTLMTDEVDERKHFTSIITNHYGNFNLRAFVLIDGVPHYGNIIAATFPYLEVGEAVDLGLSVKWSTMNLGATTPEDDGWYIAWGETEPKENYSWSTYKLCNGNSASITKYSEMDNKTILDNCDDAAHTNCGGTWRIPTYEELDELYSLCNWTYTTMNGKNGFMVTGPNSNSIFVPECGHREGNVILKGDGDGYYWSSTLSSVSSEQARNISLWTRHSSWASNNDNYRYRGQSIRPVMSDNNNDHDY